MNIFIILVHSYVETGGGDTIKQTTIGACKTSEAAAIRWVKLNGPWDEWRESEIVEEELED